MRKNKHCTLSSDAIPVTFTPNGLTIGNLKKAKEHTRRTTPRLCGDLNHIRRHLATMSRTSKTRPCEVCGQQTLWRCGVCKKKMCVLKDGKFKGAGYAIRYHDDAFFGLCRSDTRNLFGKDGNNWSAPATHKIRSNVNRINVLKRTIAGEEAYDL